MGRGYRTVDEAATFLGVAAGTVRRWIRDGELDAIATPGRKKMQVTLWSLLRRSGVPPHDLPTVFASMIGSADPPQRKPRGRGAVAVPAGAPRGVVDRPIPRRRVTGTDTGGVPMSAATRRIMQHHDAAYEKALASEPASGPRGRGQAREHRARCREVVQRPARAWAGDAGGRTGQRIPAAAGRSRAAGTG